MKPRWSSRCTANTRTSWGSSATWWKPSDVSIWQTASRWSHATLTARCTSSCGCPTRGFGTCTGRPGSSSRCGLSPSKTSTSKRLRNPSCGCPNRAGSTLALLTAEDRLAAALDDGPRHVGELDVQILGVPAQYVERALLVHAMQHHQHPDGLADLTVGQQPAPQGGDVLSRRDGVDGHAGERCQHDGLAGGFGVEDVRLVAEQVERTGFALVDQDAETH